MEIPQDILHKIDTLFSSKKDRLFVIALIERIAQQSLNVGHWQLVRSILVISSGNRDKMTALVDAYFYGDPRDLIMQAEALLGHPGHYGIAPFEF